MFDDVLPRHTLARTRARLRRDGVTRRVLLLNLLDWVSFSLHHAIWRILGVTLAIACASRMQWSLLQFLLLAPLAWLLVVDPLIRAGSAMHRQLELHEIASRVWGEAGTSER
jgi:hypothetical protein